MKAIALPMVLLMLTATLAGCTGSDPDGGDGTDGIDLETLNQLIEDNLEDFLNNTSVTVNQDFHYYNNTTTTNENTDNSVSNINGSGVGSASTMQMFTVNWSPSDVVDFYDYGNHTITLDGNLQQMNNDPSLLLKYVYNGYDVEFRNITCEEFLNFRYASDDLWEDYLEHNYGYHQDRYQLAENIEDDWYDLHEYVHMQCGFNTSVNTDNVVLFEIHLTNGQAMDFLSIPQLGSIALECDDGFHAYSGEGIGAYVGGQANCTVFGMSEVRMYHEWIYVDYYDSESNNSSSDWWDSSNVPEWWEMSSWRFYYQGSMYSSTPKQFAVYFTTYFVEVYDLDSQ